MQLYEKYRLIEQLDGMISVEGDYERLVALKTRRIELMNEFGLKKIPHHGGMPTIVCKRNDAKEDAFNGNIYAVNQVSGDFVMSLKTGWDTDLRRAVQQWNCAVEKAIECIPTELK